MLSTFFSTPSVLFLAATLLFASVEAIPLPGTPEVAERDLEARTVSVLSTTDISSFTPFTQFARAAYCPQSKVNNWSCGRELGLFPVLIVIGPLTSFASYRSLQCYLWIRTDFDWWGWR